MPFLEISHSAKVATVVGSIDLSLLTEQRGPTAAILPGTLAQAHRGVVLVDEVNRLVDTNPEIADVLLDVMGTKPGRLQIEEVGMSTIELPISATIWAASNPDEDPGPLDGIRRQLADRFDLCVGVKAPSEVEVLKQILAFTNGAKGTTKVELPTEAVDFVARLYLERNIESIRAAEAILIAARMHCLHRGAKGVETEDIMAGATLALRHRVSAEVLQQIGDSMRNNAEGSLTTAAKTSLTASEQAAPPPPGLFSRLRDVFKAANPPSVGGPHVLQSSPPPSGVYRHVNTPIAGSPGVGYQEGGVLSPPQGARRMVDIHLSERVSSEGDLTR